MVACGPAEAGYFSGMKTWGCPCGGVGMGVGEEHSVVGEAGGDCAPGQSPSCCPGLMEQAGSLHQQCALLAGVSTLHA